MHVRFKALMLIFIVFIDKPEQKNLNSCLIYKEIPEHLLFLLGDNNIKTVLSSLFSFFVCAAPIATDKPCPRDPEAILIPGKPSWVAGCPWSLELIFLKVFSSFKSKYPDLAKTL